MNPAHCIAASSGSIRHLLRSETAATHARVDARLAPLIAAGEAGYREFLRLSAAAICPLEQALLEADVEALLPDWEERSRSAALHADLADFGIPPPPFVRPPSLGGEAHQFGVLYVLEGSRLGAKVLARRLVATRFPASADLAVTPALRYLRHGEGRPLWRTFLERLESSTAVRHSPADAIAGAHAAFARFGAAACSLRAGV